MRWGGVSLELAIVPVRFPCVPFILVLLQTCTQLSTAFSVRGRDLHLDVCCTRASTPQAVSSQHSDTSLLTDYIT